MKHNIENTKADFFENEKEFESLMHMKYDIDWGNGETYMGFTAAEEVTEILKREEMKGIVLLFENGINSGPKVLTEKNPETRFERTRQYLERYGILYWVMRRQRQNPKRKMNLIPGTASRGFCLFNTSEEQGQALAKRFNVESLIIFLLDPDLKVFLVGTRGTRFQGMRRTLYRFEEPEAMIPIQHVIYQSKLYRELENCNLLIKEAKAIKSEIRRRLRER